MSDKLTVVRFADLKGMDVVSADGARVGTVAELFCDEQSHEPEWIGMRGGFLGLKTMVVPADGATVHGDELVVPYEKEVIKREPSAKEEDGALSAESEKRLYVLFGLEGHPIKPRRLTRYSLFKREGI